MKRFISFFALVCFLLMIPGYSNSASIDWISQSYTIGGRNWGFPDFTYPTQNSSSPVYLYKYDNGDLLGYATGNVSETSGIIEASINLRLQGVSSAEILFKSTENSFANIWVDGFDTGIDAISAINLIDQTTGIKLLSFQSGKTPNFFEMFSIPLEFPHSYLLSNLAMGLGGDSAYAKVSINLTSVPEPATMLLLGCGLIGLAGLRRKFKK